MAITVEETIKIWKIRYEGTPRNPRYRADKRRTFKMRGTREQAEKAAEEVLSLPVHASLDEQELAQIVEKVNAIWH